MLIAIKAGILYFAVVFTAGFGLGAVRVKMLEPALGDLLSLLIELPIILGAAWVVCGFLTRRYAVPPVVPLRAAMGVTAFVLLIGAELVLVFMAREIAVGAYLAGLATLTGMLGLLAQTAFAAFPLVRK